jgi:hypothetical protein
MGQRSRILLVGLACALLAGCSSPAEDERASAYFLWAGVRPPAELADAETVYILAGEVRADDPSRLVQLRPKVPRGGRADIWMVVRAERIDWSEGVYRQVVRDLARWEAQNRLAGLQVDFDAATLGLDGYADFLTQLRERLPGRYALSVTGLMDWSAHGDPQVLARLGGVVDEIVIQTYQGRQTIPGHGQYLASLKDLPLPYRIGIVRDGKWKAPAWLADDPEYRGEVVFLTNP